jgi:uncharacterized DUF497 family protein
VRFTWDPHKSDRNRVDRGFDFPFAASIFGGPTLERSDVRRDYGEARTVAIGRAGSVTLTVVYTDRTVSGDVVVRRIISARVSTRRERQAYKQAYPEG